MLNETRQLTVMALGRVASYILQTRWVRFYYDDFRVACSWDKWIAILTGNAFIVSCVSSQKHLLIYDHRSRVFLSRALQVHAGLRELSMSRLRDRKVLADFEHEFGCADRNGRSRLWTNCAAQFLFRRAELFLAEGRFAFSKMRWVEC